MAACLTVEEVLEEVLRDSEDDRSGSDKEEEEDYEKEKLLDMLNEFRVRDFFDESFFKNQLEN